jgi:hypothetical protein
MDFTATATSLNDPLQEFSLGHCYQPSWATNRCLIGQLLKSLADILLGDSLGCYRRPPCDNWTCLTGLHIAGPWFIALVHRFQELTWATANGLAGSLPRASLGHSYWCEWVTAIGFNMIAVFDFIKPYKKTCYVKPNWRWPRYRIAS